MTSCLFPSSFKWASRLLWSHLQPISVLASLLPVRLPGSGVDVTLPVHFMGLLQVSCISFSARLASLRSGVTGGFSDFDTICYLIPLGAPLKTSLSVQAAGSFTPSFRFFVHPSAYSRAPQTPLASRHIPSLLRLWLDSHQPKCNMLDAQIAPEAQFHNGPIGLRSWQATILPVAPSNLLF